MLLDVRAKSGVNCSNNCQLLEFFMLLCWLPLELTDSCIDAHACCCGPGMSEGGKLDSLANPSVH